MREFLVALNAGFTSIIEKGLFAARYFPSIKHNPDNIHQNFPLITFTVKDSILTMSQQHFGPTSTNSATGLHLLLLSVLLAFFH